MRITDTELLMAGNRSVCGRFVSYPTEVLRSRDGNRERTVTIAWFRADLAADMLFNRLVGHIAARGDEATSNVLLMKSAGCCS